MSTGASGEACRLRAVKRRRKPEMDPMVRAIFDAASAMTASGQEPRRHHVVPRFYLDRWAEGDRVQVTELDTKTTYEVDPKNALIETDYYRVPPGTVVGSESPVIWEAWLSKIEGDAKQVFDKLDAEGYLALDPEDLGRLVSFVAVQATRSRSYRYQMRWMSSVGMYRQYELDRPGAIEASLRRSGEDPTPERVAEVEAQWQTFLDNPWLMTLPPGLEMQMAQDAALRLADLLAERWCVVYDVEGKLITSDEPVVNLWEDMASDHVQDGGYHGTPIIVFPLGPHQVLAMFRNNMPVQRPLDEPLDWRDTLDLNQCIAGNAHRHIVSQPSNRAASKIYVPQSKDPADFKTVGKTESGGELVRSRIVRRWNDELGAPVRPVPSWWPSVVPLPVGRPQTREEWEEEYRKWHSGG
jgi:hypothetical protein